MMHISPLLLGSSSNPAFELLDRLWDQTVSFTPTLVSGLGVLLIGWLLGLGARRLIVRALGLTPLDKSITTTRVGRMLSAFSKELTPSSAVGTLVYLAILLLAAAAAADTVGLHSVRDALGKAVSILPTLVASLGIVGVGGVLAGAARRAVSAVLSETRNPLAGPLGVAAEVAILGMSLIIAVELLGVDLSVLTSGLALAATVLAVTLAFLFAWAMRAPAKEIVANYYLRRIVRLGDRVVLGGITGIAERFAPLGLIIMDSDGVEQFVPAASLLSGLSRSSES